MYDGAVTKYTYNALGWLTSTTNPEDEVEFYQYDAMGRQTHDIKVTGPGLTAEYHNSSDNLLYKQVDANLDFATALGFAGYTDLGDDFWVTWVGAIYLDFGTDDFGTAAFSADTADQCDVYIDDQLAGGAPQQLTARWHRIKICFEDTTNSSDHGLVLSYALNDADPELIPEAAFGTTIVTSAIYDNFGRRTKLTDSPSGLVAQKTNTDDPDIVIAQRRVVTSDLYVMSPDKNHDGMLHIRSKRDHEIAVADFVRSVARIQSA